MKPPVAEKAKGSPIGLWIFVICSLLLVASVLTVGVAWAVRHVFMQGQGSDLVMTAGQKAAVMKIAEFPATVRDTIEYLRGREKNPLLFPRSEKEKASWVRRFPAPEDSGYLLYSGLYRNETAASVKLIRIADGKILTSWEPDWKAIFSRLTKKRFDDPVDLTNIRATNPVLLANGDIVFVTGSGAVRLPACGREPRWVLDETMHHSADLDVDGNGFWAPSVDANGFASNARLHSTVRDDAIARVSLDGRLLDRWSFAGISNDNDLNFLLFSGNDAGDFNADPIHMNQVRVAHTDSRFWKTGDLLVSLRNPNTVLLYRPSTRKVIWRQTGPWLHQHSADFVNDHQISVFNNNVVLQSPPEDAFLTRQDINEVMIFDFETGQVTQPFKSLLEAARPRSIGEGRARILPDGGLFIEETENGRILRFSRDRLLWSFVNDHDGNSIGALDWSSYLTADEARKPLEALAAAHCVVPEAAKHP